MTTANPDLTDALDSTTTRRPPSLWQRLLANPQVVVGGLIVLLILLTAIFAELLAPYSPTDPDTSQLRNPPSAEHLLGTDEIGRDILSRLIFGARISLIVGFAAVLVAGIIGVVLGALSGWFGGWLDAVIMRVADAFQAIPGLVLALGILAVLGSGLSRVVLAIGLSSWVAYARVVRGSYLSLKSELFIDAARTTGVRTSTILLRHILPNAIGPILIILTLSVAGAILTEAALGYLGLGISAPQATWGSMLVQGQQLIRVAPHVAIFPGIAIFLTALGFNLLGEGLRDVLDPKARKS